MKKELLRYQRLAGIITESQYIKKLNEGEGEAPHSITIKLLDGWENKLKASKSDGYSGFPVMNNELKLMPGKLVKIGSGPYELNFMGGGQSRQVFYWAKYRPEHNEITVYS